MSYTVLARKYRPRNFAEVVGQEHAVRALTNALDSSRLHHAYLLTGTRGVGKTTIARILANCFNCEEGKPSEPCGKCSVCQDFANGTFLDLYEVDAASRTGVDDTRQLLENVQFMPTAGRVKVYLIDEVHMLSASSFNALLLTLEEPPEYVKFILATTDPKKIPVTVLSRCLQFHLKNIPPPVIAQQLRVVLAQEEVDADEESVRLISRAADGSMRDALSLTDQAISHGGGNLVATHVTDMLGAARNEEVLRLLELLGSESRSELLAFLQELGTRAVNYDDVLKSLLKSIHGLALAHAANSEPEAELVPYMDRLKPDWLQLAYQILLMSSRDLKYAPDARTGFEMGMIRLLDFNPVSANENTSTSNEQESSIEHRPSKTDNDAREKSKSSEDNRQRTREPSRTEKPAASTSKKTSENSVVEHVDVAPNPNRTQGPLSLRWERMLKDLRPRAELQSLLQSAELLSHSPGEVQLRFPLELEPAFNTQKMHDIEEIFAANLKPATKVYFDFGSIEYATPADLAARRHKALQEENAVANSEQQRKLDARREIEMDPIVQAVREQFNAEVGNIEVIDEARDIPVPPTEVR